MEGIPTVTVELAYEDALRLWVLVHDPGKAGENSADARIRGIVSGAINVVEEEYGAPDEIEAGQR